MKSLRYLVWGYYGYGNLGDEFMLKVIADKIYENDPLAQIHVRCMGMPYTGNIIPFPIEGDRLSVPVLKHAAYLLKELVMISKVDRLVIGGGTLFLDKGQRSQSIFFIAAAVFFAELFKKKVYVIGVGMDELSHPSSLSLLKYILDRSEYVALRDDFSYKTASSLTENKKIVRSSDILFDRSFVDIMTKDLKPDDKYIVVSMSDYFATWGTESDREALQDSSKKLIESLLDRYSGRYSVLLCAFQKSAGEKDYDFLNAILKRVTAGRPDLGKNIKLEYLETQNDARRIFEGAAFTIGMRYHALVMSAIFLKPFVGIDIEMKINQFCGEFDMPCIKVREFLKDGMGSGLMDRLEKAVIDTKKVDEAVKKAGLNFEWLKMRGVNL